jgi:hypothetical protein
MRDDQTNLQSNDKSFLVIIAEALILISFAMW